MWLRRNVTQPGTVRMERPEQRNIRTIVELEQKALHHRSFVDRVSDAITRFSGSAVFILLHAIWFAAWILENAGILPGLAPFDPFPFEFLTLIVSLEAIFLSTFVLMSQNRMSQQADKRAHLDLQINLLAEEENTLMLKILQRICHQLGMEAEIADKELQELLKKTDVPTLVNELEKELPSS